MDNFMGYQGKTCVVTGAASGMGQATARLLVELGAKVYAMDISPIKVEGIEKSIHVDLSSKDSIDEAFAQVPSSVDCYFGVAGVMGAVFPFLKTLKINLLSNKYIAERILPQRMGEGGAIAFVTSSVAAGWQKPDSLKYYRSVVDADGWDEAIAEVQALGMDKLPDPTAYPYSKMAMNYLICKLQSLYGPKHVRVNGICPGGTRSAFGSESAELFPIDMDSPLVFLGYSGRIAEPEEMAHPLIYLNSKYASTISGAVIFVDYGLTAEVEAGLRPGMLGDSFDDMIHPKQG